MPQFFREEKEISIKVDCADSESGGSPDVVPPHDLQNHAVSNSNSAPCNIAFTSGEGSSVSAEVVPSRVTKPTDWALIGSTVLLVTPMILLLFLMSTDAFARNFVLARLHWILKDDTSAIAYYSNALQQKKDSRALEARADCYSDIGDLENERADLRELIKTIDVKQHRSWQSFRHFPRLAALEAKLGDVDKATEIYRLYSTFSSGKSDTYYAKDAAYKLLLLGDFTSSKNVLAKIEQTKRAKGADPLSDVLKGHDEDGFFKLLQALVCREEGDKSKSLELARSIGDKYVYAFRDSRARSSSKNEVVPWSLEALIHLDDRDTEKASQLLKMAESEISGSNESEPILDVLKAWLLLEQGRLDDCLKLTAKTLVSENEADESVVRQNLNAALHLIRKNVFLRQNQAQRAAHEDDLYKKAHVTGRVFTPMCYRPNP